MTEPAGQPFTPWNKGGTAVEDDPASSKGAGARVLWQGTAFALREGENLLGRDPDASRSPPHPQHAVAHIA